MGHVRKGVGARRGPQDRGDLRPAYTRRKRGYARGRRPPRVSRPLRRALRSLRSSGPRCSLSLPSPTGAEALPARTATRPAQSRSPRRGPTVLLVFFGGSARRAPRDRTDPRLPGPAEEGDEDSEPKRGGPTLGGAGASVPDNFSLRPRKRSVLARYCPSGASPCSPFCAAAFGSRRQQHDDDEPAPLQVQAGLRDGGVHAREVSARGVSAGPRRVVRGLPVQRLRRAIRTDARADGDRAPPTQRVRRRVGARPAPVPEGGHPLHGCERRARPDSSPRPGSSRCSGAWPWLPPRKPSPVAPTPFRRRRTPRPSRPATISLSPRPPPGSG